MIQGNLTFNGVDSSDFGVFLHGGGTYSAPARKHEVISVPGRNGSLTLDGGAFEDVEQSYYAFIAEDFDANIEGFRNALASVVGNARLSDSFHTDEFYLARYMRGLEPDVAPLGVAGEMTLVFTRDPRRFLVSGETPITLASGFRTITNPTAHASNPLIEVAVGTATNIYFQLTGDGGTRVEIAGLPTGITSVTIDSETQDCYSGTTNLNAYVTFSNDFPHFLSGENEIYISSGITLTVTPRWFRL